MIVLLLVSSFLFAGGVYRALGVWLSIIEKRREQDWRAHVMLCEAKRIARAGQAKAAASEWGREVARGR